MKSLKQPPSSSSLGRAPLARAHITSRGLVRCAATTKQQRNDRELLQRPDIINTDVPMSQQQRDALLPQPGAEEIIAPTDSALDAMERWAGDYQMPDEMSLWDADGDCYSSRRDLQLAYTPPKSDLPSAAVALSLIACWSAMFQHAMWGYDLFAPFSVPHLLDGLFTAVALEFLSTGLFITTHDSMHGGITPINRFLNDVIGATTVSLYAWFDYSLMWTKHWEHHNMCGTPNEDPDFHQGDPALLPWFLNFMKGCVSVPQVAKLFGVTTALAVFAHAPIPNQLLFWAGSGLASAVRLFYFGTYVPHKPRKGANEVMAWAKARSVDHAPALLSFLQCYNFGMHWEHHR